jgi:hypothetical protein
VDTWPSSEAVVRASQTLPSDVVDLGVAVVGGDVPAVAGNDARPGNGSSSSRWADGSRPKLTARAICDVMADCDMMAGSRQIDAWKKDGRSEDPILCTTIVSYNAGAERKSQLSKQPSEF